MKNDILNAEWTKIKLSEIVDTIENGNRPRGGIKDLDEGIPSLGGEHLTKLGGFNFKKLRLVPKEYYDSLKRGKINQNDVLVVKDGATTGKVSFVDEDFPFQEAAVNEHIFILRGKKDLIDPKFLFYHIFSPFGQLQVMANFRGAAIGGINTKFIKNYYINLPPLETQKKIVKIMEKAEKLKEWRAEADELAYEYLKSVFLEMFGDPVKNEKGWDLFKFSEAGKLERGKSKHRPRNAPELLGGPYPLIQTGEVASSGGYIKNYTQTYSEIGLKQSRMWPSGTLCITIAANIAKTGILTFDACFPDSIVGFTPNDNVKVEYVQYWLSFLQKILEKGAPESAQKNINLKILSNLDIPIPPLKLQEKFVEISEKLNHLKTHQAQSKQEIDNLFNTLMQKAFKGELVC